MASRDQRQYARIETSLSCTMATPTDTFEGAIANLSKGGAGVYGPDGVAGVGDRVTLLVERTEGLMSLALPGMVVRTEHRDERTFYGVAFDALPPDELRELTMLLQLVAASGGGGRRIHPRVAARVEVTCRTEDLFRAWLNDLSIGGVSIRCRRDVPVGKAIALSFGAPGLRGLVEFTGTVMFSQAQPDGRFRLGVRFDGLKETDQSQVNRLLDVLLGITLPAAEVVPDNDDEELPQGTIVPDDE